MHCINLTCFTIFQILLQCRSSHLVETKIWSRGNWHVEPGPHISDTILKNTTSLLCKNCHCSQYLPKKHIFYPNTRMVNNVYGSSPPCVISENYICLKYYDNYTSIWSMSNILASNSIHIVCQDLDPVLGWYSMTCWFDETLHIHCFQNIGINMITWLDATLGPNPYNIYI